MARKGCCGKNPCPHYSRSLARCKLGYVDPKSIKDGTRAVMNGMMRPCPHTVRGQKVIQRVREVCNKTGPCYA